jgi:hypothetical protein
VASVAACLIVGNPATLPLFLGGVAVGAVIGSLRDGNDLGTAVNDGAEAGVFAIAFHQIATVSGSLLSGIGKGGPPGGGGSVSGGVPVYRGVSQQQDAQLRANGGVMQLPPNDPDSSLYVTTNLEYASAYGRPWTTTVPPDVFDDALTIWGRFHGTESVEIGLPYGMSGALGGRFDGFFNGWRPL